MNTLKPKVGKSKPKFRIRKETYLGLSKYYPQVKVSFFSRWHDIMEDLGINTQDWIRVSCPSEEAARQYIANYIKANQRPTTEYIYL